MGNWALRAGEKKLAPEIRTPDFFDGEEDLLAGSKPQEQGVTSE